MRLFLICFLFYGVSNGQNLVGYVFDAATNEPLEDVNIYLKSKALGVATDVDGKYEFNASKIISKSDTLRFSIIGYVTKSLSLSQLKASDYKVELLRKTEDLDDVYISGEKQLRRSLKFEKLAPLKKGVHGFGSILYNDKIYVVAGNAQKVDDNLKRAFVEGVMDPQASLAQLIRAMRFNFFYYQFDGSLQIYDLKKDAWDIQKDKFEKRAYHNVSIVGNQLYVLGGIKMSLNKKKDLLEESIEIYDISTGEVTSRASSSHHAINFESLGFSDYIVTAGGSISQSDSGEKSYTDAMHIYDTKTDKWFKFGSLSQPGEIKGVLVNDKILVLRVSQKEKSAIQSYDLETSTWTTLVDIPMNLENASLAYLNNIIYIYQKELFLTYDVTTQSLKHYKIKVSVVDADLLADQEALYIVGGCFEDDYSVTPSTQLYKIDVLNFLDTEQFQMEAN
ncbi:carboxypeptidase-like regulatory domain-containing protein [Sediminibacter sp. Hel_I_10]|uniref:carboxypeptidase-like regulatory domain-containing protein n=1 Tax=Sediminibacter sp. Hel_I_10 TaxID=1392490 RepID=UPI000566BDE9|nr:carboxypeptidase-like regulatory domain-containing protein [Sediminibacter sp. Hel_I_10]